MGSLLLLFALALVCSESSQTSCSSVTDCTYFQCLEQLSEVECSRTTEQEHPGGEAVYFCTLLKEAGFDAQGSQAVQQALNCSISKLQSREYGLCNLGETIAGIFDQCTSEDKISQIISNCQNIESASRSVFSLEVLNLKYGRLYSAQYWKNLVSQFHLHSDVIRACSNLPQDFRTSLISEIRDCTATADSALMILLDSSQSIGRAVFDRIIRFTLNLIDILPQNIDVGVITYSNEAHIISGLVPSHLRRNLSLRIEAIRFDGGRTGTDIGIERAVSILKNNYPCNKQRRKLFMLLMTDGRSNNIQSSISAAENAKKQHNIHIYCLPVGREINTVELSALVSQPHTDYLYETNLEDSRDVQSVLSRLVSSICKAPFLLSFLHCTPLSLTLDTNLSENYHFHTIPTEFTLQAEANGSINVYGSFMERNPNAITADFVLKDLYSLQYYIRNNHESDFFLTIISRSAKTLIKIQWKVYDTTNIGLLMAPSSVDIDFGSTVELSCSAKSSGELTFSWFEANYGITEVNVFSSLREHNNVTNTIVVENVVTNLTYQCIISSEGHVLTSQEAYIGVINVPPSPTPAGFNNSGAEQLSSSSFVVIFLLLSVIMIIPRASF